MKKELKKKKYSASDKIRKYFITALEVPLTRCVLSFLS